MSPRTAALVTGSSRGIGAAIATRLAADPARQRALHENASRWYAGQLRFAEALAHAFASGRLRWCAELVERAALRWQHYKPR